ncbi:hypothetical protein [Nonomuraea sp. NPDC003804]|uniref:hypothetical protein n=1 Tax=Nonomuraea sp. NPDC003804 TaxID=3154547 RepID=UPI0033B6C172
MSTFLAQKPIYRVKCDNKIGQPCEATFEADNDFDRGSDRMTRQAARGAGWDVPPPRGEGSRSPFDFCPEHKRR